MTRPSNPRPRAGRFAVVSFSRDAYAALAVSLAPVLYFLPAVLNGSVLSPDDGTIFNTPLRVAAADITLGGSLPLWNPYIFGGMPLLATAQGGLLFPPNWFYLVFAPQAATNLMVVSSYTVAALGAYLYARRAGASLAGAFVTSLAWQWGGFLVGQIVDHMNWIYFPVSKHWEAWYSTVKNEILDLFREHVPAGLFLERFVAQISSIMAVDCSQVPAFG